SMIDSPCGIALACRYGEGRQEVSARRVALEGRRWGQTGCGRKVRPHLWRVAAALDQPSPSSDGTYNVRAGNRMSMPMRAIAAKTNGRMALNTCSIGTLAKAEVMNSRMPVGGVTMPIMQLITKTTPNWMSGTPY